MAAFDVATQPGLLIGDPSASPSVQYVRAWEADKLAAVLKSTGLADDLIEQDATPAAATLGLWFLRDQAVTPKTAKGTNAPGTLSINLNDGSGWQAATAALFTSYLVKRGLSAAQVAAVLAASPVSTQQALQTGYIDGATEPAVKWKGLRWKNTSAGTISGVPAGKTGEWNGATWDLGGDTLSPATGSTLGGIKQGAGLSIAADGTASVTASGTTNVENTTLSTPPGSPPTTASYWVAPTATGAWAGHDYEIASTTDGGATWSYRMPDPGEAIYDKTADKSYVVSAANTLTGHPTSLATLSDVNIPAPTNGQVLTYDSGSGKAVFAPTSNPNAVLPGMLMMVTTEFLTLNAQTTFAAMTLQGTNTTTSTPTATGFTVSAADAGLWLIMVHVHSQGYAYIGKNGVQVNKESETGGSAMPFVAMPMVLAAGDQIGAAFYNLSSRTTRSCGACASASAPRASSSTMPASITPRPARSPTLPA
jgi:Protein of unknown function (DUF2793)